MALINCPECNREITDKSKNCIHCGCPIEKLGLKLFSKIWIVICIIACFFISFMNTVLVLTDYFNTTILACLSFLLGMCYISLLKNSNKRDLYRIIVVNLIIIFFIISEVFL